MCGSGASRQNRSDGLSPNGKVAIRSSLDWGVVFALASRRVKTSRIPARIGSGSVAATPTTVSLITVGFGGGWRAWVHFREGGRGGEVGTLSDCAGPDWRACVGFHQSEVVELICRRGSRCSLSAWAWIRATDEVRALMLTMIMYRPTVPVLGASFPPSSLGNSCSASSSSSPTSSSALYLGPE